MRWNLITKLGGGGEIFGCFLEHRNAGGFQGQEEAVLGDPWDSSSHLAFLLCLADMFQLSAYSLDAH